MGARVGCSVGGIACAALASPIRARPFRIDRGASGGHPKARRAELSVGGAASEIRKRRKSIKRGEGSITHRPFDDAGWVRQVEKWRVLGVAIPH